MCFTGGLVLKHNLTAARRLSKDSRSSGGYLGICWYDSMRDQSTEQRWQPPPFVSQLDQRQWWFPVYKIRYPVKKMNNNIPTLTYFFPSQQKQVVLRTAESRQCPIKTNLCILRTSFGLLPSFLRNAALNILKCKSKAPIFLDNSQGREPSISCGSNIGLFDRLVWFQADSQVAWQMLLAKRLSPLAQFNTVNMHPAALTFPSDWVKYWGFKGGVWRANQSSLTWHMKHRNESLNAPLTASNLINTSGTLENES